MRIKFYKYHGLGNDYLVIDPNETDIVLSSEIIQLICDRNYGAGSDGILYGPEKTDTVFGVRIFNPDGSEAEKSGNGLRIFSRYLWDKHLVGSEKFLVRTPGGEVQSRVFDNGRLVTVEMGKVSFDAADIPVIGETGSCIGKNMTIGNTAFTYNAVTVGNPHCVIIMDDISPEIAKEFGPAIERDRRFPNRTNVQFMRVIDKSTIQIEIWERGAGYTLASGSSSTAAAAVAFKLGLCGNDITVKMQGGELSLTFTDDFIATMTGPVSAVYEGEFTNDMLEEIQRKNMHAGNPAGNVVGDHPIP